jgi:hypothetical protein
VPGCQYDADCPPGGSCGSSNQCEPGECDADADCPVERPHCDGHMCYAWP